MDLVSDKIRRIREKKGLSQEYMAAELGITQPSYATIESGKTSLSFDRAIRIASLLGCNLMDLLPSGAIEISVHDNSFTEHASVIQNYYAKSAELYEERIQDFKDEIQFLRQQLDAAIKGRSSDSAT